MSLFTLLSNTFCCRCIRYSCWEASRGEVAAKGGLLEPECVCVCEIILILSRLFVRLAGIRIAVACSLFCSAGMKP